MRTVILSASGPFPGAKDLVAARHQILPTRRTRQPGPQDDGLWPAGLQDDGWGTVTPSVILSPRWLAGAGEESGRGPKRA